jgi:hypothetical protein
MVVAVVILERVLGRKVSFLIVMSWASMSEDVLFSSCTITMMRVGRMPYVGR